MKLLNLGCGTRFHNAWTNVDFVSSGTGVIAHNLLKGIPFADSAFDVVYHSHVLEHFSRSGAEDFLKECYRVLKKGGVIRIAVPDLERILKEYLRNLELALQGDQGAAYNYEWIKLELFDQMVRNQSGGEMAKFIYQEIIPNEDYVFERIGEEGKNIRRSYLQSIKQTTISKADSSKMPLQKNPIRSLFSFLKSQAKKVLQPTRKHGKTHLQKEIAIGRFRLGGEIHQWMYDRYSISKLLSEIGFSTIQIKDAFTSNIVNWNEYELESKNGMIHKPDSLFVEAIK